MRAMASIFCRAYNKGLSRSEDQLSAWDSGIIKVFPIIQERWIQWGIDKYHKTKDETCLRYSEVYCKVWYSVV